AVNVVYFWPDPAAALRELRRVLRPGGRLALGFRPRALVERLRFQDYGYRPFDGEELRDLAAACGFADLRLLPEPDPPSMPGVCLAGVRG
ncbi:MAG TPA: methyltransferase domain-containing protein, partial [Herpetosiphonaceae bacterium]